MQSVEMPLHHCRVSKGAPFFHGHLGMEVASHDKQSILRHECSIVASLSIPMIVQQPSTVAIHQCHARVLRCSRVLCDTAYIHRGSLPRLLLPANNK